LQTQLQAAKYFQYCRQMIMSFIGYFETSSTDYQVTRRPKARNQSSTK